MTAKSTADRQKALRERRAAQGLIEVRGIYATEENAKRIKQYAKLLDGKTHCEKCGAHRWRRDDGVLGQCACIDLDKIYKVGS